MMQYTEKVKKPSAALVLPTLPVEVEFATSVKGVPEARKKFTDAYLKLVVSERLANKFDSDETLQTRLQSYSTDTEFKDFVREALGVRNIRTGHPKELMQKLGDETKVEETETAYKLKLMKAMRLQSVQDTDQIQELVDADKSAIEEFVMQRMEQLTTSRQVG